MKTQKLLALLLALVMIFTFAACGKKEVSEKDIEKQREEELANDPTSKLKLTLDEWPVIDGATAMLPYYEEAAARILDMPVEEARKHVLCSTTDYAYQNLANGTADLIFCAPPSDTQIEEAASYGITYESMQVLNSGFVFFVNKNNPVNNISKQDLYDIYAGKITNWKELGGDDEEIIAYQRSEGSGSQTGLYQHLIPKDEVMEAPKEQKIGAMAEIIDAVADYDNAKNAIGYSYYYYITNMHYQEEVKLLAIDNVYPTNETISSGMYPFISQTSAFFRSDEPADSTVRKIAAWCAGAAGNILAEDLGYVPSKNAKTVFPSYAKVEPTKGEWNVLTQNNITLTNVDCKQDYMGEYSTGQYFQIEGLKDTKVQNKINERIKEVAENFINTPYVPEYRGAALKDLTGIKCTGIWCNENFNANNILSITVYASFNTENYAASFSESTGLNFNLKTGEEIKLVDLFDKKTDGIGYINNVIYETFNHESYEYDYLVDIVQAAPFTGIKDDQNYTLNSYEGCLDIIFDAKTPEVYTYGYPTTLSIPLQGYFDYDKFLTKKSLFTDETVNYMFLRRDLGDGIISEIEVDEKLIGERNLWPWMIFTSYEEADESVNKIARGDQAKVDEIVKLAVESYDRIIKDGYKHVDGSIQGDSSLLKIGPYYSATAYYAYNIYYTNSGEDEHYDSYSISEALCVKEGSSTPMTVKDLFKDGVDTQAVLKQAFYNALDNYNLEAEELSYLNPIDKNSPRMDEYITFLAGNVKSFNIEQYGIGLTFKDEIADVAASMLGAEDAAASFNSAFRDLSFTEIGNENLAIFD